MSEEIEKCKVYSYVYEKNVLFGVLRVSLIAVLLIMPWINGDIITKIFKLFVTDIFPYTAICMLLDFVLFVIEIVLYNNVLYKEEIKAAIQYFRDENGDYYRIKYTYFSNEFNRKLAQRIETAYKCVCDYKKDVLDKRWVKVTKLENLKLIKHNAKYSIYTYIHNGKVKTKKISNKYMNLANDVQNPYTNSSDTKEKNRSTYEFELTISSKTVRKLFNYYIKGYKFVLEEKNGEFYYAINTGNNSYKCFWYDLLKDKIIIYAWIEKDNKDFKLEDTDNAEVNELINTYKDSLVSLFDEIKKINS